MYFRIFINLRARIRPKSRLNITIHLYIMNLHFKKIGEGQPLIILHGLFGTSDNWITLARRFAESFEVYLIDQRNHGRSPHSDEFSYDLMASDLLEFIQNHNLENPIVLGHSMGGKTAMNFAVHNPTLLSKLIVVDIAPKTYPVHHDAIIEALYSLNLSNIQSRKLADQELSMHITDFGTRQFLLKNLYRTSEGNYSWRMNLDSISDNIVRIGDGLEDSEMYEGQTLFIRGGKSKYIIDSDSDLLLNHFPNSKLNTILNAGHWVHAEAPDELYKLVMNFIS